MKIIKITIEIDKLKLIIIYKVDKYSYTDKPFLSFSIKTGILPKKKPLIPTGSGPGICAYFLIAVWTEYEYLRIYKRPSDETNMKVVDKYSKIILFLKKNFY
jgi:hypothetical protein